MKKLLFVILALFVVSVRADNTITSKEYVDTQVSNLQTQIPAKNTNTVLTNTGTAGTVGEKAIYDTTAAYGTQTDALVTAGAFNSAVQNALESEFVCIEWQGSVHDNAHCLLYEVRAATANQILPSGYTQLEYLESTGTQYIDTGVNVLLGTLPFKMSTSVSTTNNSSFGVVFGNKPSPSISQGFAVYINHTTSRILYARNHEDGGQFASFHDGTFHQIDAIYYGDGKGSLLVDGTNIMYRDTLSAATVDNGNNYLLFATNDGDTYRHACVGKVKNITITVNDHMEMNFIPARRNSDGKLGMYDTVSNTFFTNSGSGEFIAGPAVSSNLYLPSGN